MELMCAARVQVLERWSLELALCHTLVRLCNGCMCAVRMRSTLGSYVPEGE